MSTPVSFDWVLSQLAGMSFPAQGGAYDYIKRCFAAQEKDYEVQQALETLTCKQASQLLYLWAEMAREEKNEAKAVGLLRQGDMLACFGDQPVPTQLSSYHNFEAGLTEYQKRYGLKSL